LPVVLVALVTKKFIAGPDGLLGVSSSQAPTTSTTVSIR
jgi:hypothetical protein